MRKPKPKKAIELACRVDLLNRKNQFFNSITARSTMSEMVVKAHNLGLKFDFQIKHFGAGPHAQKLANAYYYDINSRSTYGQMSEIAGREK